MGTSSASTSIPIPHSHFSHHIRRYNLCACVFYSGHSSPGVTRAAWSGCHVTLATPSETRASGAQGATAWYHQPAPPHGSPPICVHHLHNRYCIYYRLFSELSRTSTSRQMLLFLLLKLVSSIVLASPPPPSLELRDEKGKLARFHDLCYSCYGPRLQAPRNLVWSHLWSTANTETHTIPNLQVLHMLQGSRDGVVGVATPYEIDGPGLEPWWGRDFCDPSRPAPRSTQPPVRRVPV